MSEKPNSKRPHDRATFIREIGVKASRRIKARRNAKDGVWFGLGMMGIIGWSVIVPTLLGIMLGIWLDKSHPGSHSWTLMLLVFGLVIGCLNAWHWVSKELKEMQDRPEDTDE